MDPKNYQGHSQERVPELKLYFRVGLPDESDSDVLAIAALSQAMAGWSGSKITVSVAPFVPKARTAFQGQAMLDTQTLRRRLNALRSACRGAGLGFKAESAEWSAVQGVLARGDRRLTGVLLGMGENTLAEWDRAMAAAGLRAADYLRQRERSAPLPWAHIQD